MPTLSNEIHGKDLLRLPIRAVDGEIGRLKDIYFDDASWLIRYLVIDTGNWLPGRKVLIFPHALASTDPPEDALPLNLTKEQIRNSPDVWSDRPVSRQQEAQLGMYYGWPPITPDPAMAGGILGSSYIYAGGHYAHTGSAASPPTEHAEDFDPHLRSLKEVMGYELEGADGPAGHIEDFLFDMKKTRIAGVVVDTSRWRAGHKFSLPVEQIDAIDWESRSIKARGLEGEQAER